METTKKFFIIGNPKATTRREIELDISDEACRDLGFLHGDRALTTKGQLVTIQGAAPRDDGKVTLWYSMDRFGVEVGVCYYGSDTPNLAEAGFTLIQIEKNEPKNC